MSWLAAHYPQLKAVHVALVLASGGWFAVRGLAVLGGARWPLAASARGASVLLDSSLLLSALALLWALQLNPFTLPWLSVKLAALVAYVWLGTLALRGARTRRTRALSFVAALVCFGWMLSVARLHHPLGFFALL